MEKKSSIVSIFICIPTETDAGPTNPFQVDPKMSSRNESQPCHSNGIEAVLKGARYQS
jgi:hypothetical protein